jgi:hypothetical protein
MNSLVETLDSAVAGLLDALDEQPTARRLLAGNVDIDEYAVFLEQTYLYVRHTRPLLRRAGQRLGALRRAAPLAQLFLQKADEEDGHEKWVLADLDAINRSIDERRPPLPSHAVAAYIAWNHFQVEAGSPLGFLGTAYVLESLSRACAGMTVKNLITKNHIPGIAHGVRFLKGHADADDDHREVLRCALGVISLPSDREAIALSAAVTATLYLGIFSAMEAEEQRRQAA